MSIGIIFDLDGTLLDTLDSFQRLAFLGEDIRVKKNWGL